MKKFVLSLVLLLSYTVIFGQQSTEQSIEIGDLEGTWYVNQTDFPMWSKGNKTAPRLNYAIQSKGKDTVLFDRVNFMQNEKEKNVKGYDWSLNEENTAFAWRGKGILRLLKSNGKILYIILEEQWAITYFEKTLFTPEGCEVISKMEELDSSTEERVMKKLEELEITSKLTTISQERTVP